MTPLTKKFYFINEDYPEQKWLSFYNKTSNAYRKWFLSEGDYKRPSLKESEDALKKYMPEFVSIWKHLIKITGNDEQMGRMLSLYCPAPYQRGCSQAAWTKTSPILIRNYDYAPELSEGRLLKSNWFGTKVIAMTDCLWGALDGINEHGLSLSLAYGGCPEIGQGFSISLILRYILEFCTTTEEALKKLQEIPINMAYNVTVLDAYHQVSTIELSPIHPPKISVRPFAVNKQGNFNLNEYMIFSNSLEREEVISKNLFNPLINISSFIDTFQYAPLFSSDYANNLGTLYTAIYNPTLRATEFRWPGYIRIYQSFQYFYEQEIWVTY